MLTCDRCKDKAEHSFENATNNEVIDLCENCYTELYTWIARGKE